MQFGFCVSGKSKVNFPQWQTNGTLDFPVTYLFNIEFRGCHLPDFLDPRPFFNMCHICTISFWPETPPPTCAFTSFMDRPVEINSLFNIQPSHVVLHIYIPIKYNGLKILHVHFNKAKDIDFINNLHKLKYSSGLLVSNHRTMIEKDLKFVPTFKYSSPFQSPRIYR